MSLVPAQISDLVALGAPILCLDTCTILDVVRDITRETVRLSARVVSRCEGVENSIHDAAAASNPVTTMAMVLRVRLC